MEQTNLTGYPSIDKPWLKYYSEEAINAKLPECTVFEYLWKNNKDYLDDVALIYFGKKITYGELFREVERVRNALLNEGIRKGDKVILFTSSTPETVYAVLALCRIGAVADMINPLFTKEQAIDRINETEATLMIALEQLYDRIADAIPETCVKKTVIVPIYRSMPTVKGAFAKLKLKKPIPYGETVVSWNAFVQNGVNDQPDAPYEKDHPLIMVYSSGSTGASKGIVLTNTGICGTLSNYERPDYFPHKRGESFLQMIPVWFSTGIIISLFMPLCIGICIILEPVFSKETFVRDIKQYRPNMTLGSSSLWMYAIKCNKLKRKTLSFLHYPITGGEKLSASNEAEINRFLHAHGCNAAIIQGYGMCELGGTVTTAPYFYTKPGSAGIPIKKVLVASFDVLTDKEQKYYEEGEIRIYTPARMKEYFRNPKATAEFFKTDEQGRVWGCTGDIGYVDEDGFVFIKGRATDSCVVESGETVYFFDVEDMILKDEAVAQCKVVDIQTERGTELAAHIVFDETVVDPKTKLREIAARVKRELPPHMAPQYYKVRTSIPVHANGKRDVDAMRRDREDLIRITSES